ncbi:class I SAM-dependent DNA methyltransferase [Paenibacillus radicis (ex Xue et al. 2023)]|uniref:Class I SAM-dependent methyltransferase n=1 Tax=Paenibacillus radicis (ex Xue et al. 2023) TaxID=2972489 RepID=A0ABT1YGE1_9BACL|nr:class I SAM-dependent methyltransferase [Paenibacillus radicis (ex Xue et al. 2023)]MCR8632275.1 class I SAM-dependent methyltransferase [Paenibacillus radicis (ex Xue et al. 2023)]
MSNEIRVTHGDFQGFVAQHYDLWFSESGNSVEQDFYKQHIIHNRGPAVEIGCGTGRLLNALIRDGLDVDGVDYSEDMLNICSSKAKRLGLHPALYHQAMQRLELPRKYKTIYIPGNTFNLLTDREDSTTALSRLYLHLADGGQLLLTLTIPKAYIRNEQPEAWRMLAEVNRDDGAVIRLSERVELDFWEQLKTNFNKYEVFKDGELIETHEDTIRLRWFYQNEFELMLTAASFKEIQFNYGADRSSMRIFASK